MKNNQQLCGIDEAGRGCLAGSLCVVGVVLLTDIDGLKDSKKLSEQKREILYPKIIKNSLHKIVLTDSKTIDDIGLSMAMQNSLLKIQKYFKNYEILFDGNTSFGVSNIKCLVKADEKVVEVSAASILAKVTRDRLMYIWDKKYSQYGFSTNKGYGTKKHIEAIKKYGYCPIHRRSFKLKIK